MLRVFQPFTVSRYFYEGTIYSQCMPSLISLDVKILYIENLGEPITSFSKDYIKTNSLEVVQDSSGFQFHLNKPQPVVPHLFLLHTLSSPRIAVDMAQKCIHKGCGKVFTDPEEECVYHSGAPIFHEGQKGKSSFQQVSNSIHSNQIQAGDAAKLACSHSTSSSPSHHAQPENTAQSTTHQLLKQSPKSILRRQ